MIVVARNNQGSQSFKKNYCSSLDTVELLEYMGEAPPLHCIFKVESFSKLCDVVKRQEIDHFESTEFEAGGYQWNLSIYPSGKKTENGDGHVSLYLKLADEVAADKVIDATIKFFIYDHLRNLYLTIQDARGKRFDISRSQWGIPRFMEVTQFKNPHNGFLINDCCVFGVELLFPGEDNRSITSLTPVRGGLLDSCNSFVWKVHNFSKLKEESLCTPAFSLGGFEWKLKLHPCGKNEAKGNSLSLFLYPAISLGKKKLFIEFELWLKDELYGKHQKKSGKFTHTWTWFKETKGWGYTDFVSLIDLNDPRKGYKRNDTVIIEVKILEIFILEDM